MKKILTLLVILTFAGSVFAANGLSKFTSAVNNGVNTLNKKEQELNTKIDNAQTARAKQKEDAQKKSEAKKAEVQAKIDAQKKSAEDTKKAVEAEKNFWTGLFK